jgi:hypothetical protein
MERGTLLTSDPREAEDLMQEWNAWPELGDPVRLSLGTCPHRLEGLAESFLGEVPSLLPPPREEIEGPPEGLVVASTKSSNSSSARTAVSSAVDRGLRAGPGAALQPRPLQRAAKEAHPLPQGPPSVRRLRCAAPVQRGQGPGQERLPILRLR